MIPVHLDALYVKQSQPSSEPTADFRRLPYYDTEEGRDVNSDIPWLGSSAAAAPFENSNMTLQKGVHLHWALPDGLCHGAVVNGKLEMPVVPNRWLIRRQPVGSEKERLWVVESDYLWTPQDQAPAVNIFHKTSDDGRPYRFLGRKLDLEEWQKESTGNDRQYLDALTAIGYGESTFAAYYPNCTTVFGFHDRDLPDTWDTLQYDLIGWYGGGTFNPELKWDPIHTSDTDSLIEPLRNWRVSGSEGPQTLVCYASIQLTSGSSDPSAESKETKIAVGNTVSEALCTLLANEVAEELKDPNNPRLVSKIEEQLEALHIDAQLASEVQDVGLRLRRYRHEKSFEPVSGGERWTIHTDSPRGESLPNDVLTSLQQLNVAQAEYREWTSELEQARRQLYGDWCQYMRCVYRPPDVGRGQFLDIDEVVNYIETRSLAKVEQLQKAVSLAESYLWEKRKALEFRILLINIEELHLNMDELVAYILNLDARGTKEGETARQMAMKRLDDLIPNLNLYQGVVYIVKTAAYLLMSRKQAMGKTQDPESVERILGDFLPNLTVAQIPYLMAYISFAGIEQPSWWNEENSQTKLDNAKQTVKESILQRQSELAGLALDLKILEQPQPPQLYERNSLLAEARTKPVPRGASDTLEAPHSLRQYWLRAVPGTRFWQPADPVVLMTGGNVRVSDRHGRDGRNAVDGILQCDIYEIEPGFEAELRNKGTGQKLISRLFSWLENQWTWVALQDALQKEKLPDISQLLDKKWLEQGDPPVNSLKICSPENRQSLDKQEFELQVDKLLSKWSTLNPISCIGFRSVNATVRPWNPLFLDWGIDMHPAESHAPGALENYDSDIITGNYSLGSQHPDLEPEGVWTRDNPDRLSGRCILGDTPSLVLKERIEDVLRRRLMGRLIKLGEIPKTVALSSELDNLLKKRASVEPEDIEKRTTFRSLVELWANPEDDTELQYLQELTNWYKKLADNYQQVPLKALPTVPVEPLPTRRSELDALVKWYGERPLRDGASRTDDPLYVTLLAYQKLFDQVEWKRIKDVLQRRLIGGEPEFWANPQDSDYFQRVTDWYDDGKPTHLPTTPEELQNLVDWYGNRPVKSEKPEENTLGNASLSIRSQDPLYCTLLAYQKLFNEKLYPRAFLGQSLGGFNGELVQWKLGLSLPIDESIGLTPYREFSQRVAAAVSDSNEWTTEPTNNFSPIRSGILKLDKLRLIDNFGQVTDIPCDDKVIVPTPYQKGRAGDVFLPPRLVQPACVRFRWLDVEDGAFSTKSAPDTDLQPSMEMVEAAARSPICGWLVPEKLRGNLLVFDGDGNPLGTLAADRNSKILEWVRAPGFPRFSDDECSAGRDWLQSVSTEYYRSTTEGQNAETLRDLGELGASLQNPRLARVLLYLWATRSPQFLKYFLNTLDDAMANIDPEGTTSMGSLALLVGRPVAVVGAELDLQLKDNPAVRQDWDAFRMDQYRHDRDTDEFEQVQFRLRLGQYQSRNDGVVGYWLEKSGEFAQHTFVAQAADDNDNDPSRRLELKDGEIPAGGLNAKINAHDKGNQVDDLNFTQSVADPPLQVTLLMDPRGKANLTTGILPMKSIDIPRPLWEPAMEAMRIWFSVAPILTRPQSRRVPIPTLVDRQWSWLELEPKLGLNRDVLQSAIDEVNKKLEDNQRLEIDTLIKKGWLQKQNSVSNRVYLSPRKDRQALANPEVETKLESIFRRLYLWQTLYPRPSVDRDALHQELFRLNAELGRVPLANYDLILRGPTQGKNLIIVKKMQSEDENYYLIRVFDEAGKQVIKEIGKKDSTTGQQKPAEADLVRELDKVRDHSEALDNQKRELVEKVTSYLEHSNAGYDLILRNLQSTDTLPTDGKSLIVARKLKHEDRQYLISIFDGAGHQVTTDQVLTDSSLVNELDNKLEHPELSDHQGRELTQRILMTLYDLRLTKAQDTDVLSAGSTNLVIAQQVKKNEDGKENAHYLINIFDESGQRAVKDKKLTEPGLVSELDEALKDSNSSNNHRSELLQKIASNLGYGRAELILRRAQSDEALPAEGKNLVIAKQVNDSESHHYLITIFNGVGNQIVINQSLTDSDLTRELDSVLEFRELGYSITSNLGYTHLELDRLVEKKWLEEMKPPGDRLYVNAKEDRQSLEDWALETLLDPRLAELSLALVSPGEEADFNPGIEVREGWLLLQPSDREGKT